MVLFARFKASDPPAPRNLADKIRAKRKAAAAAAELQRKAAADDEGTTDATSSPPSYFAPPAPPPAYHPRRIVVRASSSAGPSTPATDYMAVHALLAAKYGSVGVVGARSGAF